MIAVGAGVTKELIGGVNIVGWEVNGFKLAA